MQPVGIETLRLREQRRDLLGKSRAYRLGPAAGSALGALGQSGDFAQSGSEHTTKRRALMTAHLAKRADHFGKAGDDRGFGTAPLVFALLGIR